ncbi:hypothetical protein SJAG_04364 [Schizosaccharomyces japonicus yFS275]|uniref:Multiple myeloma tumor-associated protein 2-like N-terminal domain-containing protein n=1 Tax=Schizosaccharomyces japonicus (strain yFS275 / FY16936) TaxID=402676 RepID=B6K6M7_SCHJY|nr:hypothetical protein SJAG_04364 [Schizosaccharomyces japonicus yFS275]EEB09181.1 hypothetical protein SJAG_04364 [Schizosaccharomyces japonicus yFS275]
MGRSHSSRGGTRGGQGLFDWENVKKDHQRENYLGQSLYAQTGRWAKGKDLEWWSKGKTTIAESSARPSERDEAKREIEEIKRREQELLSQMIGGPGVPLKHQTQKDSTRTQSEAVVDERERRIRKHRHHSEHEHRRRHRQHRRHDDKHESRERR